MKIVSFEVALLMIFSVKLTRCEVFSAVHNLQKLFENEKKIVSGLEDLKEKLLNMLETLENFSSRKTNELRELHLKIDSSNSETYFENPLNAFMLIRRTTLDLKQIERMIIYEVSAFIEKSSNFATEDDLRGAIEGILRLQSFYGITSIDVADGLIDEANASEKLSSKDLELFAFRAFEIGEDTFAQEYWKLALAKGEVENEDEILINLAKSFKNIGKVKEASEVLKKVISKDPSNIAAILLQDEIESSVNSIVVDYVTINREYERNGVFDRIKEQKLYKKACKGQFYETEKKNCRLKCFFHSTSYFSSLARFKVEELSSDPRVLLFIDTLSDYEAENLKKISLSKFSRSATYDFNVGPSKDRVSQISWHNSEEIVAKIDKRLEEMTGLSMISAEDLQIQNYGIGGQYSLHYDHRLENQTPFNLGTGNRIASVLIYLSDVIKGGATVFPYLNLKIPPKKGSAVFWFNLKSSGASDFLTRHAGCPVLIGSKYVANKWIHEFGQNLMCDPDGYHETLINSNEALKSFF